MLTIGERKKAEMFEVKFEYNSKKIQRRVCFFILDLFCAQLLNYFCQHLRIMIALQRGQPLENPPGWRGNLYFNFMPLQVSDPEMWFLQSITIIIFYPNCSPSLIGQTLFLQVLFCRCYETKQDLNVLCPLSSRRAFPLSLLFMPVLLYPVLLSPSLHPCWSGIKYSTVTNQNDSLVSIPGHQAMSMICVHLRSVFVFCSKLSFLFKGLICISAVTCSQKFSAWKLQVVWGACLGHPMGIQIQCVYVCVHTHTDFHTGIWKSSLEQWNSWLLTSDSNC